MLDYTINCPVTVLHKLSKIPEKAVAGQGARRVWRHQRGNQNPYIEEEQTTMAKRNSTNNDQQNIHIKLKIEYIAGQKKKFKRTNNDLQN